MLVRFTRTIPGGEKRGFVAGREFDWPMAVIRKFRGDYGQDVLVASGADGEWIARTSARRDARGLGKPSRQDRLRGDGLMIEQVNDEQGHDEADDADEAVAETVGQTTTDDLPDGDQHGLAVKPRVPVRRRGRPRKPLLPEPEQAAA